MPTVPVTIVIPTLNGGALFRRCLDALVRASPRPERILVIDSGSTDGSERAAAQAGADVIGIARVDFDHGATRQAAVDQSTTEFVAFLSQDAVPEPNYLRPLLATFGDEKVVGACARILPHDDSSALSRRTVLSSSMASAEARTVQVDPQRLAAMTGIERAKLLLFDNVASMARRSALLEHPFPRTMMGEDAAFAKAVLAAGHRLSFAPESIVHHAHEYGPVSAFCRYRDDARWMRRELNHQVRTSLLAVARGFAYEVREDMKFLAAEPRANRVVSILRSPFVRLGQVLGQYWGSKFGGAS